MDTTPPVAPQLVTSGTFNYLVDPQVTIQTSMGNIVVELYPEFAPITVANFLAYTNTNFYDGTLFHRVIENFMIQGGGYNSSAYQTPTYAPIVLESDNGLSNLRGTIAMARTSSPDSATSQFFINHVDNLFLDYSSEASPGYAVFGNVVSGLSTVDAIAQVPVFYANYSFQHVPVTNVTMTSVSQTEAGSAITHSATLTVTGLETDAQWSYSLDHGTTWSDGSGNTLDVPVGSYAAGAIQVKQVDAAGNVSLTAGQFTSALVVETTAPLVLGFSPVHGTLLFFNDRDLQVTFSETIRAGTGDITLKDALGNVVETFAAGSENLAYENTTLTINPTQDLEYGTEYVIEFDPDSVLDLAGNNCVATGSYRFTTLPDNLNIVTSSTPGIYTGNDSDELVSSGDAADKINGGNGNNYIEAGAGNNVVTTGTGDDTIAAGAGNDKITAGEGHNTIDAGNGNNSVITGNGDDDITAGSGNDKIAAGNGNNIIDAGGGNNGITTGAGDDDITSGSGNDKITAGEGHNTIDAGDGNNGVTTGAGDDDITTGSGNDKITAGNGNNTIDAGDGANKVTTGNGDDTITTGNGADKIVAGEGNNTIDAGDGNNAVTTGAGDDTITTGSGNDKITAGNGNNVIDAGDGANKVTTGTGDDAITTSSGADKIAAGEGNNMIEAGAGNDTVTTGGGADWINGGDGADKLKGGAGADIFMFDNLGVGGFDSVLDFSVVDDTIELDGSVFTAVAGGVTADNLLIGEGVTAAVDADDYLIFNSKTGALYYDADGSDTGSSAVQIALLKGTLAGFGAADFTVSI